MERLLTRGLVESLGAYYADGLPVSSVYMALSPSAERRKEVQIHLKDLISANWEKIISGRSKAEKATLEGDVDRFLSMLENMHTVEVSGLAMYSCSAKKYFETVGVAFPFRPEYIVAMRPAVAPLIMALDEFKRIAVCIVDRRSTKLYEYFMGRMEEVRLFTDDVPARVRIGGWAGYEERRIERHILEHEHAHFKNVAEALYEQFRLRGFDWLFLAAQPASREAVERVLPTYVRERLKGYIDATAQTQASEVKRMAGELADRLKAEETKQFAQRLVDAAGGGGLAVTGFQKVLEAINLSAVNTLVLRQGISQKGLICESCGTLGLKRTDCKLCGNGMTPVDNIVDKAEPAAVAQGAAIRHIAVDSALDRHEGIGAFVRFPVKNGNT